MNIWGLYRDNGKNNGNYYSRGYIEREREREEREREAERAEGCKGLGLRVSGLKG